MKVVWEGSFFFWDSLAHVNRELVARLAKLKAVNAISPHGRDLAAALVFPHGLSLKKLAKSVKGTSILIRHAYPPNFTPHDGPVVLYQPWEFMRAPSEWVHAVRQGLVNELWCNSHFTRNNYVLSGVPPEKVRVMPLGFDAAVFHPDADGEEGWDGLPDIPLAAREEEFTFLYVGGTIERKGIDILMRAFLHEFRREDPVRLIVKDTGTKHVYIHSNQKEPILKVVNDLRAPRVSYLDEDMPPQMLASLVRSCDCLIQPYRAEGFCLPVIEAMACGLPVITTFGGPTDDFVLATCGWKVATRRVPIPQLPGLESIDDQGWLEPDQSDLQRALREAYENRAQTERFGRKAAELAKSWTWDEVVPVYAERIEEIRSGFAETHVSGKGQADRAKVTRRKPQTLSCCMIARDEERCIAEAIQSVQPFVEEVIVVDTGSKDRTPAICTELGVTLRHQKWQDSFAAARNESMRDAAGDWIMWIDCDDVVPPETMAAIRHAIDSAPDHVSGFVIPVKFLTEEQVDHVKVFRNYGRLQASGTEANLAHDAIPPFAWQFRIHEQILYPVRERGELVKITGVHVLHKNYDNSPEGQAKKRKRDWKLLMLDLRENPEHPFVLFNCGMTANNLRKHTQAIPWLKKSIANSGPRDSIVRKTYVLLAQSQLLSGKVTESKATLLQGLTVVPGDPEMLFNLAEHEMSEGNFDRAVELYHELLRTVLGTEYMSFDHGILGFKTLHNLGNAELARGNYEGAKSAYFAALKDHPTYLVSAYTLYDAAMAQGDFGVADSMLAHVAEHQGLSKSWVAMLKKRQPDIEPALRHTLDLRPDADAVRLELAELLLNTQREDEAIPHLELLAGRECAPAAFFLGVLAVKGGRRKAAGQWFSRAHELNPSHPETLRLMEELTTDNMG